MTIFAVAVAAPIDSTLSYSLPEELAGRFSITTPADLIGRRVLVPLGRRKVTGYVIEAENTTDVTFTIRNIIDILDSDALFPSELLPLFSWMSRYYHYPLGEVIQAALPGGLSPRSTKVLALDRSKKEAFSFHDAAHTEWGKTLLVCGKLSERATRELLISKKEKRYILELLEESTLELREELTGNSVKEKHETCYQPTNKMPRFSVENDPDQDFFSRQRQQIFETYQYSLKLSEIKTLYYLNILAVRDKDGHVPRKELLGLYSGAGRVIGDLVESGFVVEHQVRVHRSPLGEQLDYYPKPSELTTEQSDVLDQILPAINSHRFQPFLLHGVTGSGKTEVYLQAAEATLVQGRSVLIIVPEIALATQLEAHFISRFGDQVVLLHSGLTATEKFDQWHLALTGKAKIVIGARSAIFAPLENLGLIVVDEEHDSGLKQDDSLRYNGRDVAVVRAQMQGAVVLLGSATPSIVSFHNSQLGKYKLVSMTKRVGERPLPRVTLIDLRNKAKGKNNKVFRAPLREAIQKNLERGKQSVLLLNRRGFSTNVICQECGTPVTCSDCNVSLTLHKSKQQLLCHYCGYTVPEKTVCASCGGMELVPLGLGTERVEEELAQLFPDARVARLDTDTAKDRKSFLKTLTLMRTGGIDILIGTQMVAKGHHFPNVTLVGVVWADGGLNLPDYRSAEKTFQLVTQVTGRAGRGDVPGEVFIQTMRPEHYAITLARTHDYQQLAEKELEARKNPKFPPYVRLAVIHINGESETKVQQTAVTIAAACRKVLSNTEAPLEILGPAPSPLDKIKKKFRWQVLLKSEQLDVLHEMCRYVRENKQALAASGCKVILDIDPESLM